MQLAGARVVKVESLARPDGLRRGDPALFDLLNAGKQSVALDLDPAAATRPSGLADLRRLLAAADVGIESSRPRALEHWGIRATDVLATSRRLRVWLSPSPGTAGTSRAELGGLRRRRGRRWPGRLDGAGLCFCADAVADPATGLVAAAACLSALRGGGQWLIDVG